MKKILLWTISVLIILTLAFAVFSSKENAVKGTNEKFLAGPSGRVLHRGTHGGVTWEVYSNGHLLFKPTNGRSGTFGFMGYGVNADDEFIPEDWLKYSDIIRSISFKPGIKTGTGASGMFFDLSNVKDLDLNGLDTSNTTDMTGMFFGMKKLKVLDLSRAANFDTSQVTSMYGMFSYMNNLKELDLGKAKNFDTSKVTNMQEMFADIRNLKELDLGKAKNFDTSKVTNMKSMFRSLRSITSLNLGRAKNFDTKNVTNMFGMFDSLYELKSLDLSKARNFDTRKVTNMQEMFRDAQKLEYLNFSKKFDTRKVTNMRSMFEGMKALKDLDLGKAKNFDTRNVTNMEYMFYKMSSLKNLDLGKAKNFDTSKVTNMSHMFAVLNNLLELDLGKAKNFDTRNVTDMSSMFNWSNSLKKLDLSRAKNFDTRNVTDMSNMFHYIRNIRELDLGNGKNFDTSKVTNMQGMFYGLYLLKELDLSKAKNFDTSKVTNMKEMFFGLSSLKELDLSKAKNFDTRNVTNMKAMFFDLFHLKELDLGKAKNFDTSKVTNMSRMFDFLSNLKELDLGKAKNFDTSNVTNMKNMFSNLNSLKELNLSKAKNFDTRNVKTMWNMFYNSNVEKIVFSKKFRFPNLVKTNDSSPNLIVPRGEGLTGRWSKTSGSKTSLTVEQLYKNPSNLAGTWVWEKKETINITQKIKFEGGYYQIPNVISVRLYKNGLPTNDIISLHKSKINFQTGEAYLKLGKKYKYKNPEETILNKYTYELVNEIPNFYKSSLGKYRYVIPKMNITIEKNWRGGSSKIPSFIKVLLKRNNEPFRNYVLRKSQNWSLMVSNLDRTDKDGRFYNYSVKEITKIEGFKDVVNNFVITNFYKVPYIDFTKTITIKNGTSLLPKELVFDLYRNGEKTKLMRIIKTSEFIENMGMKAITFESLEGTDYNGNEYKYDIGFELRQLPEGFEFNKDGTLVFKGKLISKEIIAEFIGGKDERPRRLFLYLKRKTKEPNSDEIVGDLDIETDEKDRVTRTISNLPQTTSEGSLYTYYIEAADVSKFVKDVNGLKVKYTSTEKSKVINAKIIFIDGAKAKKPDQLNIYLIDDNDQVVEKKTIYIKDGKIDFTVHDDKNYTINADNISGFDKTIDKSKNTITYRYREYLDKVDIKFDVDDSNAGALVDVVVKKAGEKIKEKTNVENYKPTYFKLPKYNKEGTEIEYTLEIKKQPKPKAPIKNNWWAC